MLPFQERLFGECTGLGVGLSRAWAGMPPLHPSCKRHRRHSSERKCGRGAVCVLCDVKVGEDGTKPEAGTQSRLGVTSMSSGVKGAVHVF